MRYEIDFNDLPSPHEKATPRPWRVYSIRDRRIGKDGEDMPAVWAGDNEWNEGRVCVMPHVFVEQREANAHLIVTAVNSHTALVEALQACLKHGLDPDFGDWIEVRDRAREALRLAQATPTPDGGAL